MEPFRGATFEAMIWLLKPEAMARLLPKMLPLVIPHFMPRMVAYLRGRAAD